MILQLRTFPISDAGNSPQFTKQIKFMHLGCIEFNSKFGSNERFKNNLADQVIKRLELILTAVDGSSDSTKKI